MAVTKRPRGGPNNARKRQNYFGHCRARAYTFLLCTTRVLSFRVAKRYVNSKISCLFPFDIISIVHALWHGAIVDSKYSRGEEISDNWTADFYAKSYFLRKLSLASNIIKSSVKGWQKFGKIFWKVSALSFLPDSREEIAFNRCDNGSSRNSTILYFILIYMAHCFRYEMRF